MRPVEIDREPTTTRASRARTSHLNDVLLDGVPAARTLFGAGERLAVNDETLIVDDRSGMGPAQMVENKLSRMLKDGSMPVSHLQMRGLLRPR